MLPESTLSQEDLPQKTLYRCQAKRPYVEARELKNTVDDVAIAMDDDGEAPKKWVRRLRYNILIFVLLNAFYFGFVGSFLWYKALWVVVLQMIFASCMVVATAFVLLTGPTVYQRERDRLLFWCSPDCKTCKALSKRWCAACGFYRPKKTTHCRECKICVQSFDHHCGIMDICIGWRNYHFFFLLAVALFLYFVTMFGSCIYVIDKHSSEMATASLVFAYIIVVLVSLPTFLAIVIFAIHVWKITTRYGWMKFLRRFVTPLPPTWTIIAYDSPTPWIINAVTDIQPMPREHNDHIVVIEEVDEKEKTMY